MLYLGEIAAIITSITYAFNSALFTLAGREVGSSNVNRLRLVAASLLLAAAHWILLGSPWPVQAEPFRWYWLGVSGIVGLVLGDAFLFQAFILVGPRLSMLMMSLAPILAGLMAWIFLGERLGSWQILGILITLIGVAWVVLEKNQKDRTAEKNYSRGVLFGLGAAVGQALGLVLAKNGLGGGFSPLSANFIRMVTAMTVIWGFALARGEIPHTISKAREHPAAVWKIIGGAFSGPFLGVSLALFALQRTSIGVASTLMALPPLFLLPVDYLYFKQSVSWRAIAGTGVALCGVAILFLS